MEEETRTFSFSIKENKQVVVSPSETILYCFSPIKDHKFSCSQDSLILPFSLNSPRCSFHNEQDSLELLA